MHTFFWIIQKNLAKKDQQEDKIAKPNISQMTEQEKIELSKSLIKKAVLNKKPPETIIMDTDGNNIVSSPRVRVNRQGASSP